MAYYRIETSGGYAHDCFSVEKDSIEREILDNALETKKITIWVEGRAGIVDDWGRPVTKSVKRITKYNDDGTKEIIYEKTQKGKNKIRYMNYCLNNA